MVSEGVILKRDQSVLNQHNWIFRTRRFTKGSFVVMYVMIFGCSWMFIAVVICVERKTLVNMQNTHSHTELDTVPPLPV